MRTAGRFSFPPTRSPAPAGRTREAHMTDANKRGPGRPRKTETPPSIDNDRDLLTAAEIDALQAEVEAEAADELREQAKKSVKAKLRAEARLKRGLEEPQQEVTIDLAPYADRLL